MRIFPIYDLFPRLVIAKPKIIFRDFSILDRPVLNMPNIQHLVFECLDTRNESIGTKH
jgi:hypothetical protein